MATISNTPRPGYVWDSTDNVWYPIGVGAHNHNLTAGDVSGVVAQTNYLAAGKNLVHNGNFAILQRTLPYAGLSAAGYNGVIDRWYAACVANSAAITISQENDAPQTAGVRQSLKYLFTTANTTLSASERVYLSQKFEGQFLNQIEKGTASAKTLTLSFWVKSNVTGTYNATFIDNTNSRGFTGQYTINASGTWEKKTIVVPADTTGAFANDTSAALEVRFWQVAGTNYSSGSVSAGWVSVASSATSYAPSQVNVGAAINNYWQITAVQLEIGSTASSFALAAGTPQGELALCQRYYYRKNSEVTGGGIGLCQAISSTIAQLLLPHPVTMRTTPSIARSGLSLYNATQSRQAVSAIANNGSNLNTFSADFTAANLVAGNASGLVGSGTSTTDYIEASAEL